MRPAFFHSCLASAKASSNSSKISCTTRSSSRCFCGRQMIEVGLHRSTPSKHLRRLHHASSACGGTTPRDSPCTTDASYPLSQYRPRLQVSRTTFEFACASERSITSMCEIADDEIFSQEAAVSHEQRNAVNCPLVTASGSIWNGAAGSVASRLGPRADPRACKEG